MVARALPVTTGTEQSRSPSDRAPGCRRSGRRHGYRGDGRHGWGDGGEPVVTKMWREPRL